MGVPGNFDTTTQEIVNNCVLTVPSRSVHKPLSENLVALVAFNNRKLRMRFDLGHFTPGRSLSSQLVIRLSSSTVPHPIGSPGQPSSPLVWLLYPSMHSPMPFIFALHTRQIILRDGIH